MLSFEVNKDVYIIRSRLLPSIRDRS